MKHLVKAAVGGVLALASASVFAQAPVLPSTGNGSVTLTLLSTNDATPFSYSFNLGLTLSQLSALPTSGSTSFALTGLATDLAGFTGTSSLVFDVTAASQTGGITTPGAFKLATTFDPVTAPPATVAGVKSGALSAAEQQNNLWLTNWSGTANNQFTTSTTAANYANGNYNAALNTFPFNAAAAVGTALPFYELSSNRGATSTATLAKTFPGLFTLDLATDTLTYTVSAVPLPAGVWLLLSGLAGLGVFGRRRAVAPQA